MPTGFLLEVFAEYRDHEAILFGDEAVTFGGLLEAIERDRLALAAAGVKSGDVVSLEADFSSSAIARLLALVGSVAIVAPISPAMEAQREQLLELGQVERRAIVRASGEAWLEVTGRTASHPLFDQLRSAGHPGLLLFTSGSSGQPKGVVHDFTRLLEKYRKRRHRLRTLMFLLFDHIGGVDTLFQALSNGCAVVVPTDRTPEGVCVAIERHRVQVLPASPSFLSMLLLSEAHLRHDLRSLEFITYGAEVMPQATLDRLAAAFPSVKLLQKYGLTELGTLRSQSASNDSLLVRIGGEGFETRVVDGLLQIRAASSMLGYLNAPSPFTEDGWFMTGDVVEQHGDYLRIRGRDSDLVNVGGRKVYPAEVEGVIAEVDNVVEVAVRGERHPLLGQIVVARVTLEHDEDVRSVEARVRDHCRARLEPYQVPVRVEVVPGPLHTARHKVTRR